MGTTWKKIEFTPGVANYLSAIEDCDLLFPELSKGDRLLADVSAVDSKPAKKEEGQKGQ